MNNNARRPLLIDGVKPKKTAANPRPAKFLPAPRAKTRLTPRPPASPKQSSRWQKLQLPLLLAIGAVSGFFVENLALGLGLVAAYALIAFIKRVPSRTTFTLVLLLVAAISALLLFKPNPKLINNFATYAFALLLVGVITLGREARHPEYAQPKYKR